MVIAPPELLLLLLDGPALLELGGGGDNEDPAPVDCCEEEEGVSFVSGGGDVNPTDDPSLLRDGGAVDEGAATVASCALVDNTGDGVDTAAVVVVVVLPDRGDTAGC